MGVSQCVSYSIFLSLSHTPLCLPMTLSLLPAVIDTRNVFFSVIAAARVRVKETEMRRERERKGIERRKEEKGVIERGRCTSAFWEKLQHRLLHLHRRFAKLRSRVVPARCCCSFAAAYGPWPRPKTSTIRRGRGRVSLHLWQA